MDTAHIGYNCFQRFEPGPDTFGKYLLGRTLVVLSDLLHQQVNKIISFLVSTNMLTFQYVLLHSIWFMASWTHLCEILLVLAALYLQSDLVNKVRCHLYPIHQNTYFHQISKESFLQRFHIPIIHYEVLVILVIFHPSESMP